MSNVNRHHSIPRRFVFGLACVCAVLVAARGAQAQPVDGIEVLFGATNIHATTGSGGLTAGVSRDGDLTVLSWPSPSYFGQVHYMTTNGQGARNLERMGAREGMGAFSGIVLHVADVESPIVTFFHDDGWTQLVAFVDNDTSVIQTVFSNVELGLTVLQTEFIPVDLDVLVRRTIVEVGADYEITDAWLIGYANLSPGLSRVPEVPVTDFLIDQHNDFLAVWDASNEAIVHFHPGNTGIIDDALDLLGNVARDFGPLGEILTDSEVTLDDVFDLVGSIDTDYASGVYINLSSEPRPDGFQIGLDATDTCGSLDDFADNLENLAETYPDIDLPIDPSITDVLRCGEWDPAASIADDEGWLWRPEDALSDARDGELSNSPLAGAQVNTALRVPLDLDDSEASADLFFAFGATADEANQALQTIRSSDIDDLLTATIAADQTYVSTLDIPADLGEGLVRFCTRAFLNLRVGMDSGSAAIVASISRQPPYFLDWPRDGAFFNAALDIAGRWDLVSRRLDFYSETMRDDVADLTLGVDTPVPGWPDCSTCLTYPADSWEMNNYADGMIGGNVRLEIDNTALLVWSYVFHVGYVPEEQRSQYMEHAWPIVERAANFLAYWRDSETGLNWPANEDDNFAFTQGLQSAVTVFGALVDAARLALALGHDDTADAWLHRAGELRSALFLHLYREGEGFLSQPDGGLSRGGASNWAGWPSHVLDYDDERLRAQLEGNILNDLSRVRGEGDGAAYVTKSAIAVALVFESGDTRDAALEIATTLAEEIADQETHFLGEVFLNVDDDDDGTVDRRVNAVSTPHLWAATLVYLTAMAYHHPERFDLHHDVLPEVVVPDVPAPGQTEGDVDEAVEAVASDMAPDVAVEADVPVMFENPADTPEDCGCSSVPSHGGFFWTLPLLSLVWVFRRLRRS